MKRVLLVCSILVALLLSACGASSSVYTVTKNNVDYVVDKTNKTISDGHYTYQYDFSGNSSNYSITIRYPNGASYWWNKSGYTGHGGWSDNYDEKHYVDGDILTEVILERAPREKQGGQGLAAFILAAVGVFNILSPETAWQLEYGWRFKHAEPSDMALGFNRVGGVIAVIAAVILLFT